MTSCWFSPAFLKPRWELHNLMHLLGTPNPNSDSQNGIAFSWNYSPPSQSPCLLLFPYFDPQMNISKPLCSTLQILVMRQFRLAPHETSPHSVVLLFFCLTELQSLHAWVTSTRYASLLSSQCYKWQLSTWSKLFALIKREENFSLWIVWCEHLF